MALIFVISGASLFFALDKGSVSKFIKDKVLRLVVPLVIMGMIIFGSLQIYLDRISHGEFNGTFFGFIPRYFQPGNFAWSGVHVITSYSIHYTKLYDKSLIESASAAW